METEGKDKKEKSSFWLVQLVKDLDKEDFRELMAALSLIYGFTYMTMVTFITLPTENQRFADIILGAVISVVFGRVFGHYFDKSEAKKEDTEDTENV